MSTVQFPDKKFPSAAATRGEIRELKFLIDADQARAVMAWAREQLLPDVHSDPAMGDSYYINNLYLDTPDFDIYFRGPRRRSKYRLRRYAVEPVIWLEQKTKRRSRVSKCRTATREAGLANRFHEPPPGEWSGDWFRVLVDEDLLSPVCQVSYRRFARFLPEDRGCVRLTIDDQLSASACSAWCVPLGPPTGTRLLADRRILELKFPNVLPELFRKRLRDFGLVETGFSKYRTAVEACGLPCPLPTLCGQLSETANHPVDGVLKLRRPA